MAALLQRRNRIVLFFRHTSNLSNILIDGFNILIIYTFFRPAQQLLLQSADPCMSFARKVGIFRAKSVYLYNHLICICKIIYFNFFCAISDFTGGYLLSRLSPARIRLTQWGMRHPVRGRPLEPLTGGASRGYSFI